MNFVVITLLCHSNLGVLSKNHWKLIVIDNAMLCTLLGGCHSTLDALKFFYKKFAKLKWTTLRQRSLS